MTHLRYDHQTAAQCAERGHPQVVMRELGITYQHATPQSLVDQWWFWNCKNIPEVLPDYLTVLHLDPRQCVGMGLSLRGAEEIAAWEGS